MHAKVVVVGSLNMDLVARAERLPRGGETLAGDSFFTAPGGKGANQAVAAARLGASVAMIGNVGDDAYGQQLRQALQDEGVDCQAVAICEGVSSGLALIVVDAASQNAIVIIAGGNGQLTASSRGGCLPVGGAAGHGRLDIGPRPRTGQDGDSQSCTG